MWLEVLLVAKSVSLMVAWPVFVAESILFFVVVGVPREVAVGNSCGLFHRVS